MFYYQAYGLNISSSFPLCELPQGRNKTDIYIKKSQLKLPQLTPTSIQRQGIEALFGGTLQEAYLHWPNIVSLLAKDGTNLIVHSHSNKINSQLLNLYILSEALGLILYQRGYFLLHASAVKIGEEVVIFVGSPGTGKSTTAAAFAKHGYTVLADDMVAIKFNSAGKAIVYPAFPQIKIWPSAVQGLGYNLSALPRLFPGSRKRVIRQRNNFPLKPFPLSHIFFLEDGAKLKISRMEGTNAFFILARYFPLPSLILQGYTLENHFQKCLQLLSQVKISKIEKPQDFFILEKIVFCITQQMQSDFQDSKKIKVTEPNLVYSKILDKYYGEI